jgi:predicted phosphodiesterase
MKIGIISDIHSNLEALDACREEALREGVEAYVCLGDMVNYGPDPGPTLDRIMALPGLIAVLGNHDEAMFREPVWSSSGEVEQAAAWTRSQLRTEHLEFLKNLHYVQHAHGAAFAHATFDYPDNWEYVVDRKQAKRAFSAVSASVMFFGHVHWPQVFVQTTSGDIDIIDPLAGESYPLNDGCRYLVNVGSVGQPRDGINAACFVVYDDEARTISFRRAPYDHAATAGKILAAGLHPFFAERLARGH